MDISKKYKKAKLLHSSVVSIVVHCHKLYCDNGKKEDFNSLTVHTFLDQ